MLVMEVELVGEGLGMSSGWLAGLTPRLPPSYIRRLCPFTWSVIVEYHLQKDASVISAQSRLPVTPGEPQAVPSPWFVQQCTKCSVTGAGVYATPLTGGRRRVGGVLSAPARGEEQF